MSKANTCKNSLSTYGKVCVAADKCCSRKKIPIPHNMGGNNETATTPNEFFVRYYRYKITIVNKCSTSMYRYLIMTNPQSALQSSI